VRTAGWLSFVLALATLVLLIALHVLSPEFDPSWRVVSEYANGHYGWLLSLMFAAWALSSWTLAFALRADLRTLAGKIGWWFLLAAGASEALAAAFDINNPVHGLADVLSLCLPVAAILISVALSRIPSWSRAKTALLLTANLSWISVVLLIVSLVAMFMSYTHAGGQIPANGKSLPIGATLPHGTIAVVGYANRLLVVVYNAWVMVAAWTIARRPAA